MYIYIYNIFIYVDIHPCFHTYIGNKFLNMSFCKKIYLQSFCKLVNISFAKRNILLQISNSCIFKYILNSLMTIQPECRKSVININI